MTISAYDVLEILWQSAGLCQSIPKSFLRLTGDPTSSLPSSFNLGVAAQASIAAAGLAAAHMRALSTSEEMQMQVTVDARHAALEFHSEAYYTLNGAVPGGIWDDIAGTYPTKDSFVRIHTNFPHHREGILSILGLSSGVSRETVAQAIAKWNSRQFEEEAANRGMCATAMRSFDEWDEHPHALAIRDTPPVQLIKLSDAPPRNPFSAAHGKGALDGVRVLDLTRVIAGPVCGRTLAAYGADVLLVTSPNLPSLPNLDADTSRGKRTTQLDLTTIAGRDNLRSLIRDADVFLQAYRPGGLAEKGFGPTDLARIKPGIVCANLTAWGWEGPWKKRRGFDSLVQTATGFNVAEAQAFASYQGEADGIVTPKPFPVQALDHAAGYLLAFGIAAALCKTITEGGSWEVRVSLAGTGNWIRSLGRLEPPAFHVSMPKRMYPPDGEVARISATLGIPTSPRGTEEYERRDTELDGTMLALRHSAIFERTPGDVREAPVKLDLDLPLWLPRNSS